MTSTTVPDGQPSPHPPRALVVGGSTGIGRGIADAWAAAGARVVVGSRTRPGGPGTHRLGWLRLDLSQPAAVRTTLQEAVQEGLDAACFSAVSYGAGRAYLLDVPETEWRAQCEINLIGLFETLAVVLPPLREAGTGLFVGVSSEVAFNAGPGRAAYAATKAAAKGLLDSVALEETEAGVRVVQVLPAGMVDTPGIRRRRPPDFDYSTYMVPADFTPLATELLLTRGAKYHGNSLVVGHGGSWWSAVDKVPVSQSRSLAS